LASLNLFLLLKRLIIFNLVGYSPLVHMNSAHHMLTYACGNPAANQPFWFVSLFFCWYFWDWYIYEGLEADHVVVINWLFMDGLEMHLHWHYLKVLDLIKIIKKKENSYRLYLDIGFAVGRNTPYKYIVVNIHYLSILKNDNSGNQLIMSRTMYVDCLNKIETFFFIMKFNFILDVKILQVSC
jgi:hypothetical protein